MVGLDEVEAQLKDIGCNFRFIGRAEIKELAKIIHPGEVVAQATNGFYDGGVALLVVTSERLLLVDKKPFYLTIEDVRFDMIAEINYNYRLLNSSAEIFSTNKTVRFSSWNHGRLRALTEYLQARVMMLRHLHANAVGDHVHNRLQEQFTAARQATHFIPAVTTSAEPAATAVREQTPEVIPSLAQVAMQTGPTGGEVITGNPYARKLPSLSRRRKFPSFY